MEDPPAPPKAGLTCPACHTPISPGDKFCEKCGAKIPALFTCTKCGTQFIHASEYCELCGGPMVLSEVAEPTSPAKETVTVRSRTAGRQVTGADAGEAPDETGEEVVVPFRKKTSHRHAEDTDEQDIGDEPEETDDGKPLVPKKKPQHQHSQEIREPDTEALLEEFGKEYDPEETLESHRKVKSRPQKKQDTGSGGAKPSHRTRESSGTVDDALLLAPEHPDIRKPKPRGNRITIIAGGIVMLVIVAALVLFGLPILAGTERPVDQSSVTIIDDTPAPAQDPSATTTPAVRTIPSGVSGALVPQPTQTPPSGQKLYFQVQKSPITARILVIFAGSAGHGSIRSADVKVTHPDGSVATGMILPLKGITEIILDGSKGTDRVEIIARMSDGTDYRVYDELVPLMT